MIVELLADAWKDHSRLGVVVVLSFLVACFGVGTSAAQDDLKAGATYEKQGQFFSAAEAYARALRLKPRDQKARHALERTADRAIEEKLRSAEMLEAQLRMDQAIVELDLAARLRERLAGLGIEPRESHSIAARKENLVSRRIQALLSEAESARADGLWSAAIAHLQRVDALRPGSDDTLDRLHEMWAQWGDTNVREGRLRAAAERYEQAALVSGTRSSIAAARAAAIRVGMAESALGEGACRAAVADLRKAEQLELLRAEVRRQSGAEASEFFHLLRDSSSTGTQTCTGRTIPGVDGEPMNAGPYSSVVRVTSVSIVRQPTSSVTRQTRVNHGSGVDTLATYEEYRDTLTGTISGWVTLTDQRAAAMSIPLPVRATAQATALWQRSPVSTITRENVFTGQQDTAVNINVAGRGKAQAEAERLQARSDLVDTLIRKFATEAARRLLSTVDLEPAVADPTELPGVELPPWPSDAS